eukprot:86168-Rhodomonas_salina.3
MAYGACALMWYTVLRSRWWKTHKEPLRAIIPSYAPLSSYAPAMPCPVLSYKRLYGVCLPLSSHASAMLCPLLTCKPICMPRYPIRTRYAMSGTGLPRPIGLHSCYGECGSEVAVRPSGEAFGYGSLREGDEVASPTLLPYPPKNPLCHTIPILLRYHSTPPLCHTMRILLRYPPAPLPYPPACWRCAQIRLACADGVHRYDWRVLTVCTDTTGVC